MPVPQGEDPEFQRQSVQADFPLLRLPQGRRCFFVFAGVRKPDIRRDRAALSRAGSDSD